MAVGGCFNFERVAGRGIKDILFIYARSIGRVANLGKTICAGMQSIDLNDTVLSINCTSRIDAIAIAFASYNFPVRCDGTFYGFALFQTLQLKLNTIQIRGITDFSTTNKALLFQINRTSLCAVLRVDMNIIQPLCRVVFSTFANFRHRHRNQERLNCLRDCRRFRRLNNKVKAKFQVVKRRYASFVSLLLVARPFIFLAVFCCHLCFVGFVDRIVACFRLRVIFAIIVCNKFLRSHYLVNREANILCRFSRRRLGELLAVVTTFRRKVAFHQILMNRDRTFFTSINRTSRRRCGRCICDIRRGGGEGADAEGHYGAEDAGKETF